MRQMEEYGFAVMPYGEKKAPNGSVIDFDQVYEGLIRPAIQEAGLDSLRCDEIGEAGWIHRDMFHHLLEAQVVVVDISLLNPNVFYELGIRHGLRECITVLIRREGTRIPFNLGGFRVLEYGAQPADWPSDRKKLTDFIRSGMASHAIDSPIHQTLPDLRVSRGDQVIPQSRTLLYSHADIAGGKLGIKTGDIRAVRGVDVWVNSENTNMQMARYYDMSVSGIIRYLGAEVDYSGHVISDPIGDNLGERVGTHPSVMPGAVLPTISGRLEASHGVKWIFHAASVVGQVGAGYRPIQDIGVCVQNALEWMDDDRVQEKGPLRSILFPLLGTGDAQGNLREAARTLLRTAHEFLVRVEASSLDLEIFFLAYTESELLVCESELRKLGWELPARGNDT